MSGGWLGRASERASTGHRGLAGDGGFSSEGIWMEKWILPLPESGRSPTILHPWSARVCQGS